MSGANLEGIFDPNQFQPTMGGGQSLPISDQNGHLVSITESEMKPTKDGAGSMLQLNLRIENGPYAGTEGTWNLNLGNANAVAVRIAQQELACICHAVGYLQPLNNSQVLHNKPFRVVVGLQKGPEAAEKGYTEIKKVLRADGSKLTDKPNSSVPAPAPAPQQFAPSPQQAPAVTMSQPGFPVPAPAPAPQQFAPAPQQFAPAPQFAPQQAPAPQAAPNVLPWAQPPQQ